MTEPPNAPESIYLAFHHGSLQSVSRSPICDAARYTRYIRADLVAAKDAEIAGLREALERCVAFLTDDRIGNYTYMERSDFYTDADKVAGGIRAALDPS